MNAGTALYAITDTYLKAIRHANQAEAELIAAKSELATAENALRSALSEDDRVFRLLTIGETLVFVTDEGVKFVFTMGQYGESASDIQIKIAISL